MRWKTSLRVPSRGCAGRSGAGGRNADCPAAVLTAGAAPELSRPPATSDARDETLGALSLTSLSATESARRSRSPVRGIALGRQHAAPVTQRSPLSEDEYSTARAGRGRMTRVAPPQVGWIRSADFRLRSASFRLPSTGSRLRSAGSRLRRAGFRLRTAGSRLRTPIRSPSETRRSRSRPLPLPSEGAGRPDWGRCDKGGNSPADEADTDRHRAVLTGIERY